MRRREERELPEAPIGSEVLVVRRVAREVVVLEPPGDAEVQAHGVGMRVFRQGRIDVEARAVVRDARTHGIVADGGDPPLDLADRLVDHLWTESTEQHHLVGDDVPHAGQRADGTDPHAVRVGRRRARGREVCEERREGTIAAAPGEERGSHTAAQESVDDILRAVDALIDGEAPLVDIRADGLVGLDEGEGERKGRVERRPQHVLTRRVRQHQDQDAVDAVDMESRHDVLDRRAVDRGPGEDEVCDSDVFGQESPHELLLLLLDAGEQRLVRVQQQSQHADARRCDRHRERPSGVGSSGRGSGHAAASAAPTRADLRIPRS